MSISEKKMVSLTYDLYVGGADEQPELMEQATKEQPLTFCYGVGMMLDRFETNLKGMKAGDKFDFVINHDEAYGEYDDANVIDLPKNIFEVDGKFDTEMVSEGNVVPLMDSDGNRLNAMVVSIGDESITVDLNHPLAGEDLHFVGDILEVRDASEEELKALLEPSCGGCGGECSSDGCGEEGCDCGGH
jgi:FKBP-type peptidyl-prolyl cis-trans isomerase SlyD